MRRGDFDDPAGLRSALRGGERMLLISSVVTGLRRVAQHRAAIEAAKAAGVRHVVYTSLVGVADGNPAAVSADHLQTERALAASGLGRHDPAALLARRRGRRRPGPGGGADRDAGRSTPATAGSPRSTRTTPPRRRPPCSPATATRGETYDLTGPELLTVGKLASITSELTGRPVEFEDVDDDTMLGIFQAVGADRPHDLVSFGRAIRDGWLAVCSDEVQRLTGRPARSMRELLEASLAIFSGDVAGLVGGQEADEVGDVLGCSEPVDEDVRSDGVGEVGR